MMACPAVSSVVATIMRTEPSPRNIQVAGARSDGTAAGKRQRKVGGQIVGGFPADVVARPDEEKVAMLSLNESVSELLKLVLVIPGKPV